MGAVLLEDGDGDVSDVRLGECGVVVVRDGSVGDSSGCVLHLRVLPW